MRSVTPATTLRCMTNDRDMVYLSPSFRRINSLLSRRIR